eukprot:1160640-Pelagomonas_calceolata.AAC.9
MASNTDKSHACPRVLNRGTPESTSLAVATKSQDKQTCLQQGLLLQSGLATSQISLQPVASNGVHLTHTQSWCKLPSLHTAPQQPQYVHVRMIAYSVHHSPQFACPSTSSGCPFKTAATVCHHQYTLSCVAVCICVCVTSSPCTRKLACWT